MRYIKLEKEAEEIYSFCRNNIHVDGIVQKLSEKFNISKYTANRCFSLVQERYDKDESDVYSGKESTLYYIIRYL